MQPMQCEGWIASATVAALLLVGLPTEGCAGVRLRQEPVTPFERHYPIAPNEAWQDLTDYVTASGLGIRYQDPAQRLLITDYVYERNALGLVSARYRNHYRIHLMPSDDGTRLLLTVVSEEDPEMNGQWRDITAPDKADALAGALWEVFDPLFEAR